MKKAIDILISAGAISFLFAIIQKLFFSGAVVGCMPTSFFKFSAISLLLAIALSIKKS